MAGKIGKKAQKIWKCYNAEYLDYFLRKQYGRVKLEKPSEICILSETTQKRIYFIKDTRRVIYRICDKTGEEYFSSSSWFLYIKTCHFHKKKYGSFNLYSKVDSIKEIMNIKFIEGYIVKIANILEVKKHNRIDIYLIEKEIMRELFGTEEVTGFFDPLKSKIYVDKWDINVTHEIIHALMHEWGLWTNLFCYESIAEALKKPIVIPMENIKNIKNFSDIFFTWETLSKEKYGMGGLFFRFLFEIYGTKKIKKICCISKDDNSEKMEENIQKITRNNNIVDDFVTWFTGKKWNDEDWYFQNKILREQDGII